MAFKMKKRSALKLINIKIGGGTKTKGDKKVEKMKDKSRTKDKKVDF